MSINSVNTNIAALIGVHVVGRNAERAMNALVPLATGSRINRGADDPAGLIASENLRASLARIDAESRALERDEAVANVADGAMSQISDLVTDVSANSVAAANTAGMSRAEREALQLESDSAIQAADRIASTAQFNGQRVLDGSVTINVGGVGGDSITIGQAGSHDVGAVSDSSGSYTLADVASGRSLNMVDGNPETRQAAISQAGIDVASARGRVGAYTRNVIESQRRANDVASENTAAANSVIRDTDYAGATGASARAGVMFTASMAALRAANQRGRDIVNYLA